MHCHRKFGKHSISARVALRGLLFLALGLFGLMGLSRSAQAHHAPSLQAAAVGGESLSFCPRHGCSPVSGKISGSLPWSNRTANGRKVPIVVRKPHPIKITESDNLAPVPASIRIAPFAIASQTSSLTGRPQGLSSPGGDVASGARGAFSSRRGGARDRLARGGCAALLARTAHGASHAV